MRVSDSISWTNNESELKAYLGLNGDVSEDIKLRLWLEAAIELADEYLNRDFVLIKVRFNIQSGVGTGDQFEIEITPNGENTATASYTVVSGDTQAKVAYKLRESLSDLLDNYEYSIYGSSADVWVDSGDPDLSFDATGTYTPDTGTSGFVANFYYDDIPESVKYGVYEYVKALREIYRRTAGIKSVKTGALAEVYGEGSPNQLAFSAAKAWWSIYKKDKLIDGNNN